MPISKEKVRLLLKVVQIAAIAGVSFLLVATAGLVLLEHSWERQSPPLGLQEAFFHGTIGTELLPLPVLEVLPDLFPENFGPPDKWIERFGFLRYEDSDSDKLPQGFTPSKELPIGFTVSNRRPQSGAPSPVEFVGFSCILCHSNRVHGTTADGQLLIGPGNTSLNLFAWLDALQASVLDENKLTVSAIVDAYNAKSGNKALGWEERAMISLWLSEFRKTVKEGVSKYDAPFGNRLSLTPECVPTGPVRTQPFRTIVRRVLDRPGTTMCVYTKIATLFLEQQTPDEWSQFDGSIRNLNARSALAAFAAGATIDNLTIPEIANNVKQATEFTKTLRGPSYGSLFPNQPIDQQKAERGKAVYMNAGPIQAFASGQKPMTLSCNACHGHPEGDTWVAGELQGQISPLDLIKTDPERVTYRYSDIIPEKLYEIFPRNHPFKFEQNDLRAPRGYVNARIYRAFVHAPYLHNGTIVSLAELINLKPRQSIFYRGINDYDPDNVGLHCPPTGDEQHYFRVDTSLRGNSNQGHDYPWAYGTPDWNKQQLEDLLEYLKTL